MDGINMLHVALVNVSYLFNTIDKKAIQMTNKLSSILECNVLNKKK